MVFSTECYAHRDKCISTEGIGNPWLNFCIMQSPLLYLSILSVRAYTENIYHHGSISPTRKFILNQ